MIFVTYTSNISQVTTCTDDKIKHRKGKQENLLSLISGPRSESPSTKFGQSFVCFFFLGVCLALFKSEKLFYKGVELFYTPTRTVWEFKLLHIHYSHFFTFNYFDISSQSLCTLPWEIMENPTDRGTWWLQSGQSFLIKYLNAIYYLRNSLKIICLTEQF